MIAVIDDDASIRSGARTLLKSLGYGTATFASAEEFLESERLQQAACLIIDVQMPGMGGIDLQNHLKARGNTTPVIFVTAFPEEELRRQALSAGAFGFLAKPFDEERLIACLEKALAQQPRTDTN